MVIIHVMGGLGNQLYQYALSEKLKALGKEVKLDFYAYKYAQGDEKEWRKLELDRLWGLEYEECTLKEHILYKDSSMKLTDRVRRKLFGRHDRTVNENGDYMPEIYQMDDVYLYGFWGCEKYYEDIIPLLQQKINFPESDDPKNIKTADNMAGEESVSLHIRRRDYLTVDGGRRYMGICTDEYYRSAMAYIDEKVKNPVYYIFSDDAEYVREHFNRANMKIVDWNKEEDSLYDIKLMSCCKHNICANSTFSIWGARLNKNENKIMIRPLHHDNYETSDIAQIQDHWKNWFLIDPEGMRCTVEDKNVRFTE